MKKCVILFAVLLLWGCTSSRLVAPEQKDTLDFLLGLTEEIQSESTLQQTGAAAGAAGPQPRCHRGRIDPGGMRSGCLAPWAGIPRCSSGACRWPRTRATRRSPGGSATQYQGQLRQGLDARRPDEARQRSQHRRHERAQTSSQAAIEEDPAGDE